MQKFALILLAVLSATAPAISQPAAPTPTPYPSNILEPEQSVVLAPQPTVQQAMQAAIEWVNGHRGNVIRRIQVFEEGGGAVAHIDYAKPKS